MLNLRENRDELIRRALKAVEESDSIEEFEYEPSAIIEALFESKETQKSDAFKERKLKKEKLPFFSNSNKYIKRKDDGHK
jgi:Arc/MetJ-type ribon-helix-helix transcriptional regulator